MEYLKTRSLLTHSYSASIISEERFLKFLRELKKYLNNISKIENEETGKTSLRELFKSVGYKDNYKIEPYDKIDLAIYENIEHKKIEVIIETKLPNSREMVINNDFNKKAFAQICYYAYKYNSSSIKNLIITDYTTLYIFKANEIKKIIDSPFFPKISKKALTEEIYADILKNFDFLPEIKYGYINFEKFIIKDIEFLEKNIYLNNDEIFELKRELTAIYKVLSPQNLLELNIDKDMNELDDSFYRELLYIFGVEERQDSDNIIKILRIEPKEKREHGSILELTFAENSNLTFEESFELNIIWLNRILFLKLLEARLLFMHQDIKPFMNIEIIPDFRQLENLFFEVMAKEIEFRKNGLEIFSRIPYMNSSLFEKKDAELQFFGIKALDSNISLKLYANSILKNSEFKTLNYIFRFLDSYDFGSNKYQEVSKIDKTLIKSSVLGLIFEKVNGYKDGSHFTPSFITQKLAKDSLDKFNGNLKNIKVLDPAVGSGHILVSVMNELIVRQIELKGRFGKTREVNINIENDEIFISDEVQYIANQDNKFNPIAEEIQFQMFDLKKRIIENNLFGVDINSNSVEIARLRLWIELLKWSYYDENNKFTVLPNLDINIKVGNSLVSRFKVTENINKIGNDKISRLQELGHLYFKKSGIEKRKIIDEIKNIKNSFIEILQNDDPQLKKIKRKILDFQDKHGDEFINDYLKTYNLTANLFSIYQKPNKSLKKDLLEIDVLHQNIQFLENLQNSFEWRFEFPDILNSNSDFIGFDLIIANPPYIRQERIKDLKPYLEKKYKIYNGTADIYTYFFELAFELLSKNGVISFITSNKWTRAKYGQNLREFILQNSDILQYVDLNGIKVFAHATVDTSLIFLKHRSNDINIDKNINKVRDTPFKFCIANEKINISKDNPKIKEKTYSYDCFEYSMENLSPDTFSFANSQELEIKKKIEQIGTPLKNWDIKINYGIKTGFNEAFIISTEKRNEILNNCTSSDERERTEKIIKKILRGRDIKRYSYEWADLWIINFHNNPPVDIKLYPAIKQHLDQFYPQLAKRTDKGETPYNLRNCAYLEEFEKEKIVFKAIGKNLAFSIVKSGIFILASSSFLTSQKNKYILGILSSKVVQSYIYDNSDTTGAGDIMLNIQSFEKIPIPKPTEQSEKVLINLVDYNLFCKENNMINESNLIESVIDIVVFGLYFEESMKRENCYILDLLFEKLETTNKLIEIVEFLETDKLVQRSLIYSYEAIDEVKIINGK